MIGKIEKNEMTLGSVWNNSIHILPASLLHNLPFQVFIYTYELPPNLLFSKLNSPSLSHPS